MRKENEIKEGKKWLREAEDMIDRYLEKGELFALYEGDLKSVCVVVGMDDSTCELKNMAIYEKYRGQGS